MKVIKGLIVAALVIVALTALYHLLPFSPSVDKLKKEQAPAEEKYTEEEKQPPHRERTIPKTETKIAIIIDDIGFKLSPVKELLKVSAPIAFAILPNCPYSLAAAEIIHRAKREILLHLPMEPRNSGLSPGEGALFRSMDEREIRQQLEKDLSAVPYAIGVNNHMGSAFMEEGEKLHVVLRELKEKGLFFIDSRTTPDSRAEMMAEKTEIRFASRKLFLDNDKGEEAILNNLLGHLGKNSRASMIIIGHPYPTTVKALKEAVPIIKSKGIRIVPPSELVEIIGRERLTKGND